MDVLNYDLVIIGSGPGGGTAALYAARAGLKTVVLHGEQPGGQLTTTTELENFPGWKGTGPGLVEKIEQQATDAGAEFKYEVVTKVNFSCPVKVLETDMGVKYRAKTVIIATGATAMYLGIPSEEKFKGRGVSGCATCDGPLYKGKDVVVVGGGDAAAEEALFLSKICKSVHMIHRRDQLRASLPMRKKVEASTIKMVWNSEIDEILGDTKVKSVRVKNNQTGEKTEIPCDGVFICIGHRPATAIFKDFLETDQQGYIITNGTPETNIPGVFACGDCADKKYRQAITSAGTGCQAALLAERYLAD